MSKELLCLRPVVLFLVPIGRKLVSVIKTLKSFVVKDKKKRIDLLVKQQESELFETSLFSQLLLKLSLLLSSRVKRLKKKDTTILLTIVMFAVRSLLRFTTSTILCVRSVLNLTMLNVFKQQTSLDKSL